MIRAVIFDMDGTLFDTEIIYATAWRQAGAELGFEQVEEAVAACTGRNTADTRRFFEQNYAGIMDYDRFMEVRTRYYDAMIAERGIPVKAGVVEALTYLKKQNIKIALATATRFERTVENLTATGLIDFFDVLITGDMVKNGKPDPETFLLAAERLGLSADECVGVEDSFNGVRAIAAAKMFCVMVPDVTQPSDEIKSLLNAQLESMHGLPALVERFNG